ncbi:S8 family serine peptidase [Anaerocolumna cellulosilytica]|nr:S8 family serine peptidase [Anaerocolumna cellulosilytica]MBB5195655.1 bacillopeptidase F [Anaerocolumna cellulosilytica]
MNKGRVRKIITVLLLIVMSFNTVAAALAESNQSSPISSVKEELRTESMHKIDANFTDSVSEGEYAEAIVYLKSQVDSMGVANEAKSQLSSLLTPYKSKIEVRKEVIGALKDTAEDTQQKLIKYLDQEEEKGTLTEYKPYYIINAIYVKATKEVIENISYMTEVEKIYENKIVKIDEPKVNAGEIQANADGVEWNIERIRANEVWGLGIDGTGVVVGIIDTGATWNHPALRTKWRGYNPNDPSNPSPAGNWYDPINGSTLPADEASIPHGTHVLGTILGQEPDGSNKIGAAPGATWIAAKAFTPTGGSDSNILAAAEWMLAPGGDPAAAPDIINNSWGGASGLDEWFKPMVTAWRAAGIIPVFSSGNERNAPAPPASVSAPANYPESFAVGALDINNKRGDFSRRGPGPYGNFKPDVIAPGVNIRSSVPGGYEGGWDGTSMSAPAVSGTMALILSANNSLSIEEVETLLKETAVPLEDSDDSGYPNHGYGYGLIDAFEAVSRIAGGTGIIEGKVLVEGEDLENPVILHNQEVFETYSGSGIQIKAEISDDVSVIDTELLAKSTGKSYWVTLPLTKVSGNYKSGVYSGTITDDIIGQSGFSYKIKARDYDGNVVTTEEYKVAIKFGAVPDEYATDFESYPIGWKLGGDWQWGEPATGIGPTPLSGTKLLATNLSGNYSGSGDYALVSVPIDLRNTNLEFAQFRVNHWFDFENNRDKGTIFVTKDFGETWTQVGPAYTGTQNVWKEVVINLNSYIGSPNPVFIAFRVTTDSSVQKAGWYLNDAKLIATDTQAPAVPTNLSGKIVFSTVALKWNAAPDNDIYGYKIYRSDAADGEYTVVGETSGTTYGDSDITSDSTYYYKVATVDFAGNESALTAPLRVKVGTLGAYVYLADFENDNGNFTTGGTNNSWEWGVPKSGPGAALYGEKVWATSLAGNYLNSSNAYIESPEIQLPADENSVLTVGQWYEIENKYDKGYIQIAQKTGDSWSAWADIAPGGFFTGEGKNWNDLEIPLAASYTGKTIKIRFLLTSDGSVVKTGWYIDYVLIDTAKEDTQKIGLADRKTSKNELNSTDSKKETEVKDFQLTLNANETVELTKYETVSDEAIRSISSVTTGLPVDAVVTVLETGRSVKTSPADGRYKLKHAVNEDEGTWTLRAEAYGFYPSEATVHLEEDKTVRKNFVLQEIPKGIITGKVVDRYSGEPASFAAIRVKEDSKIPVATANENGEFTITDVYEGTYTLKVIADGFEPGEVSVIVAGGEASKVDIPLKRFVGYEEEIVYDDGTGENALVLNAVGNGLAIRVTPAQYGKVKGANIFFWGSDWPNPGGNQIGITLYDTDDNGNPVKLNVQPKIVEIVRGEWNYIDLSEFGFSTARDFFIATYQTGVGTASPGTGIDEASPYGDRSYLYAGDTFKSLADEDTEGGLMIRARMEYSVDTPDITNLKEVNYTNKDAILVEGKVTADGKVNLYTNGVKVDEVNSVNKTFRKEITLTEDRSIITATSELNGKETEPSVGKLVIKDKVAPHLTITSPADGLVTKDRVVDIVGTVQDDYFDRVEINDEKVEVVDGSFVLEKIVRKGENVFTVKAFDLAGNVTEETVRVILKSDLPFIMDLQPVEDISVTPGETVTVSFRSEPEGKGAFRVVLPSGSLVQADNAIVMEEVEAGFYVGTWVAPEAVITGLAIEAEFTDKAGNKVSAVAEGKINVVAEQTIRELTPSQDITLSGGEVLTISFRSKEGGEAAYRLVYPGFNVTKVAAVSMAEVTPGYYVSTWIAPANTKISGLVVEVIYTDAAGNKTTATAEGIVNVVETETDNKNTIKADIVEKVILPNKLDTTETPIIPIVPIEPKVTK